MAENFATLEEAGQATLAEWERILRAAGMWTLRMQRAAQKLINGLYSSDEFASSSDKPAPIILRGKQRWLVLRHRHDKRLL